MAKSRGKNGAGRGRRKFLKTMTLGAGSLALPIKSATAAFGGRSRAAKPCGERTHHLSPGV